MKINSRFAGLSPWRHRFTSRPVRVSFMVESLAFLPPSPQGVTLPSAPGSLHYRGFRITPTHRRYDWPSDQPSHRPLPDNTQHSQWTDICDRCAIRSCNPTKPAATHIHVTDRTAIGIGWKICNWRGFSLSIPVSFVTTNIPY
jgi:hypothetical protein